MKTMKTRITFKSTMIVLAAGLLVTAPPASAKGTDEQVQEIAENVYLYGLQQVIFYGQRWTSTQNDSKDNTVYSGVNRFSFVRQKITPDFPVVTPNATTLYGSAYFDMQKEPLCWKCRRSRTAISAPR